MIRSRTYGAAGATLAILLLAACSQPPVPPPAAPSRDIVAAIRAAGADDHSVVEVAPLRDPAVDGLLADAHAAERAGQYRAALDKTDAALKLSPDSPDILQYRAELEVRLGDYPAAEADARRSFELGPRLGGLCARNWQTVLEIERLKNDPAAEQTARSARDQCHKAGPVRM